MIMIILTCLLLCIAGVFKAKMDYCADSGCKGLESNNKWKLFDGNLKSNFELKKWYYLWLYKPKYIERFPYSSTILVFLTDTWHRNQFVFLKFIYTAIAINITTNLFLILIYVFVIFPIVLGVSFELFYNKFKNKTNDNK